MELIKKIFASIFILVGFAFLGLIICAAVLLFSPTTQIFGYSYTSVSEQDNNNYVIEQGTQLEGIVVNTYGFDVKITHSADLSTNIVSVSYVNKIQGFYNNGISKAEINKSFDNTGTVLTVDVVEPQGIIFNRDSYVQVSLPIDMDISDIQISTNKGNISVGASQQFICENLSITAQNALSDINISQCNVTNQLNITNIAGIVAVSSNISAGVNIDTNFGTFTFQNVGDLNSAKSFVVVGENPSITANIINTSFSYTASIGLVRINTLNGNSFFDTSSADINIDSVNNAIGIGDGASGVTIQNLGSSAVHDFSAIISSNTGNINIKNAYANATLSSVQGNITVQNVNSQITTNAKYGTVNITFNDDENYLGSPLTVTTESGTVNVNNVKNVINITSTSNSVINVQFDKISGVSSIIGGNQKLSVKTPLQKYKLVTKSINGNVSVKLGSVEFSTWNPSAENVIASTQTVGAVTYQVVTSYINFGGYINDSAYTDNVLTVQSNNGTINVEQN